MWNMVLPNNIGSSNLKYYLVSNHLKNKIKKTVGYSITKDECVFI